MRCVTLLWLRILEIPKARFKKCGLLFSNCNSVFARVEIKSGNVFLLLSSLFISSFNLHFPKKVFQNLEAHSRVSRILLEWTCSIVHIYVLESLFGRQAHKRHDVLCGKYYLITSRVRKQHGTSTELSRVPLIKCKWASFLWIPPLDTITADSSVIYLKEEFCSYPFEQTP